MRRHASCVLAAAIVLQGCADEQVVRPPSSIVLLTEAGSAKQSMTERPLTDDAALVVPVMRVSSRLIAAARQSIYAPRAQGLSWTIAVYDDPATRAFVRSDGVIAVSTGAFRLAETEAGLAALLGHELAHALSCHMPPRHARCFESENQQSSALTYEDELDADGAGLKLMADAGYDPRELLRLWERMKAERRERDKVVEHVNYGRRMEEIGQRLPEAIMRYERTNRAPQNRLPSR